jgi:hypothetical protein
MVDHVPNPSLEHLDVTQVFHEAVCLAHPEVQDHQMVCQAQEVGDPP